MECPYCKKEMREGFIPATQYRVRWIAGPPPREFLDTFADREQVWLSELPMLTYKTAEAFYCPDCKTVILPVKEFKDNFDKFGDKVDEIGKKFAGAFDRFTASREEKDVRREAERRERESEKRQENIKKGKDPWEL